MVDSVATVWLPVKDMTRAVASYRDTLGLTITSEDADWSEIDADGLMIGLDAREEAGGSSRGGAVISFTPDGSIEDELERIKARGAEITGEISDHEWGRILPFQDSEGNDLQLCTPPTGG